MRLQLALNVKNLESAVEYYSALFDTPPAKRKPGYANFAIENPPLKLVLFETAEESERLNHLGVEVMEASELESASKRLEAAGLVDHEEEASTCCFARQDKVWSIEPDGLRWEWYRVLEDSDEFGSGGIESRADATHAPAPNAVPERCC